MVAPGGRGKSGGAKNQSEIQRAVADAQLHVARGSHSRCVAADRAIMQALTARAPARMCTGWAMLMSELAQHARGVS